MQDSEFCYIHSFGKKTNISLLKRPLTHIIVAVILCFVGLIYSYHLSIKGPTKDNQERMLSSQSSSNEILRELMKKHNERMQKELLVEYPLGYVIFAINYRNIVLPYNDNTLANYDINWKKVRIIKNTEKEIAIQLPDFKSKSGKGGLADIIVGGTKKVGYLPGAFAGGLMVLGEILDINENGIVFLVGFAKAPKFPHKAEKNKD